MYYKNVKKLIAFGEKRSEKAYTHVNTHTHVYHHCKLRNSLTSSYEEGSQVGAGTLQHRQKPGWTGDEQVSRPHQK